MVAYDSMSRVGLIETIRSLEARLASAVSSASNPLGDAETFPVFGEWKQWEFETSPHAIRIFDRETTKYLAANDAALKLYGYTREEFLALTVLDTRHPEEHADLYDTLAEHTGYLRHKGPRRHVKKSGEVIVVELVMQDIFFSGRPARLSFTLDVTERVRMEALLHQRKHEFESLAENLPDLVARFDREQRYIYVNSAVEALTGRPRSEIIGRTQAELSLPPEIVGTYDESLTDAFATGRAHTLEFRYPAPDGERQFEAYHVPERGATGAITTVLCVARDITERMRAKEELRQQNQLLEAIIDNMPVGLTIKDARSLRYLRRNRFSENIVGYSQDECIGKTAFEVFPQERAEAYHASDLRALAGPSMVEIEQTVVTKSGEIRIQLARKVPILDKHGQPCLVLSIVDDVTERKRAEEDLRQQKQLLDAVIDNLPVGLTIKDACSLRFLRRNRCMEKILGYSEDECVGKTDFEVFPREVAEFFHAHDLRALAMRGMVEIDEKTIVSKSGQGRIVYTRKVPIFDEHGQPRLLVSISDDITERKRTEAALRESEAKYRNLVESSRDLIWSTDADGRITFINQAAREIYGYEPEEMLGRRLAEFFDLLHARKGIAFFREMLARDRTVPNYECQVLRKDGTPIVLSSNAVVLRDGRGRMTGVTGVSKDVTPQKEAERELRKSEERFRLLAENIRDVFWIASSANDRVLYASPVFEDIWGVSRDELYRDAAVWLRSIHPEDLPAVRDFTGRNIDFRSAGIEYRIIRPAGEIRWIWDRSYTMTTGDEVMLLCGIAEDITERKRMEAERLAREIRQRETLVREVHHRIKNHLQGIAGLLRQKSKGNPAFASLAESAVAELQSVAVAFGLRANLESGHAELKTMLEAIIASVRGVTGGRISMEYGINECEQVFVTENEKVPLALVLNEVIFNALKHCTERGAKKSARIAVRKLDGSCRITVTNKGRLAPGFSFARGRGMGSGLELVKSLLPPKIVALTFTQAQGMVNTMLTLAPSLIATGEPAPTYREEVINASAAEAIR